MQTLEERHASFTPFVVSIEGAWAIHNRSEVGKPHSELMDGFMPEWLLLFYVQQTFACVGPGTNGEVDMAWMMEQAPPPFSSLM